MQAYRVIPPRHFLVSSAASSDRAANAVMAAIRQQKSGALQASSASLYAYDDGLAYEFKHPRVQGSARFSPERPTAGTLYCAYQARTALAERAFQQWRFIREQGGGELSTHVPTTQISFDLTAMPAIDVRQPPFDQEVAFAAPGQDYAETQAFAQQVRDTTAAGIVYTSVRDIEHGANLALFSVEALARSTLDRRRVRDWFVSVSATSDEVIIQSTSGTTHHFGFDAQGRPV